MTTTIHSESSPRNSKALVHLSSLCEICNRTQRFKPAGCCCFLTYQPAANTAGLYPSSSQRMHPKWRLPSPQQGPRHPLESRPIREIVRLAPTSIKPEFGFPKKREMPLRWTASKPANQSGTPALETTF